MPRKNPFAALGNAASETDGKLNEPNVPNPGPVVVVVGEQVCNVKPQTSADDDKMPKKGNPFGLHGSPSFVTAPSLSTASAEDDLFAPPPVVAQETTRARADSEFAEERPASQRVPLSMQLSTQETNDRTPTTASDLFEDDGGGDTLCAQKPQGSVRHGNISEILPVGSSRVSSDNPFKSSSGSSKNVHVPASINPTFMEEQEMQSVDSRDASSTPLQTTLEKSSTAQEETIAQLRTECDDLRRQLRDARHQLGAGSSEKMSPRLAIRAALRGGALNLDMYKSRSEKEELLDAATVCGHGDILKMCCRFVATTLATAVVHDVLRTRPVACQHFSVMLRQRQQWDQLLDLYNGVGWQAERGMLLFERAMAESNPSVRCSQLEHCLLLAEEGVCLTTVAPHLRASIALLNTQAAIEAYDANPRHTADNEAFARFPKRRGVPLTPAIATLYYGCLYHFHSKDTVKNPGYPPTLKKGFGTGIDLHEAHYLWTAVKARAHVWCCMREWRTHRYSNRYKYIRWCSCYPQKINRSL
eukprot:m.156854 g.156854  ORF g.156854 m.156854 type:complete len:529 (+) comp17952_c0_seq1:221-1807(+)